MPYNFVADRFHTKKLFSTVSLIKVRFYAANGRFAFMSLFWGLGTTYGVHLGLIEKRVVNFVVLTELISLGVTVETLRAKINRKSAISSNVVSLTQNCK